MYRVATSCRPDNTADDMKRGLKEESQGAKPEDALDQLARNVSKVSSAVIEVQSLYESLDLVFKDGKESFKQAVGDIRMMLGWIENIWKCKNVVEKPTDTEGNQGNIMRDRIMCDWTAIHRGTTLELSTKTRSQAGREMETGIQVILGHNKISNYNTVGVEINIDVQKNLIKNYQQAGAKIQFLQDEKDIIQKIKKASEENSQLQDGSDDNEESSDDNEEDDKGSKDNEEDENVYADDILQRCTAIWIRPPAIKKVKAKT